MGDRVNIYFKGTNFKANDESLVVFYSHWGGSDVDIWLAAALRHASPRWNDPAYATRMIISCALHRNILEETGFGIYATELKNITPEENGFRVVDFETQTVYGQRGYTDEDLSPVSFTDYVKNQLID